MKTPFIVAAVLFAIGTGRRVTAAFNESAPLFTRLTGTVVARLAEKLTALYAARA